MGTALPSAGAVSVSSMGAELEPRTEVKVMGRDVIVVERPQALATVHVTGTVPCVTCGRDVHVDFTGLEGTLGVRFARMMVERGRAWCPPCTEQDITAEIAAERAKDRERLLAKRLDDSGIPERWRVLDWDKLERDPARAPAIAAAEGWASSATRPRGLLLHGKVGRGKTVIAGTAAMARLKASPVRWLSVSSLLLNLRMPFNSPEYRDALRAVQAKGQRRAALILDDLDKMPATDAALQPLFVAIDGWMSSNLPLLVTMNCSPHQLAQWAGPTFGEPLTSRLIGYCAVHEVGGRDRRLT